MTAVRIGSTGRGELFVNQTAWPKKFGHEFSGIIVPEDDPMFANPQATETGQLARQSGNIPLPSRVKIGQSPSNALSRIGMQLPEGIHALIR
jgi:hypothetical protein